MPRVPNEYLLPVNVLTCVFRYKLFSELSIDIHPARSSLPPVNGIRHNLKYMDTHWIATHTNITLDPEVHHVSVQISGDRLDEQERCLRELDSIGIKCTQIKSKTVRWNEIMMGD
ncbi:hypothetical protein TNIN_319951 [Trichonephila inaurata madagascariensis]|uniref:Uncharacterized protein n=1 Tax=Trichonephila inaurata madagascariensis TaxID=2747483 RepID=A0A8X6YLU3_9ARAC|nr:hypothetical protein TNIN_319951 [Trichonephila inaurata madagascariensis]